MTLVTVSELKVPSFTSAKDLPQQLAVIVVIMQKSALTIQC